LLECFETIQQGCGWNSVSIRVEWIDKVSWRWRIPLFPEFLNRLMPLTDTLYSVLQKEITTVVSVRQHLQRFCRAIGGVREGLTHMPF
jgi:hypothetical protein